MLEKKIKKQKQMLWQGILFATVNAHKCEEK